MHDGDFRKFLEGKILELAEVKRLTIPERSALRDIVRDKRRDPKEGYDIVRDKLNLEWNYYDLEEEFALEELRKNPFYVPPATEPVTLADVYRTYRKWLHVTDPRRIDLVLAVALTRMLPGTKVWLLIISNSGDWKSEQVNALNDGGITTRVIRSLSSRTLVSGDRFAPDLAPTLKDKIVLLPEMAQILTLHPNEKTAVWAQLRDLYDGYAGKDSGTGKSSSYSDLNVTLIGCSTPYIDMQVNLHQALGSRELIYRPPKEDETNENEIMKMALQNEHAETEMRRDLRYITQQFLHHRKYTPRNFDDDSLDLLKTLALFLTVMRAPAEWDTYTGELIGNAHPEKPTRVLKQLVRMYAALLSLDDEYEQHRAMSVLAEVIRSSAVPNRMAVYFHLMLNPNKEWTEYGISQEMKIGRKSVYRELNVLWNLGLVTRKIEESEKTFSGRTVESYKWSANHAHPIHSSLLKEYSSINNNIPIHIFKSENSQLFSKSETCACGELILKTDVAGMILKKCASCQPEVPLKREKRRAA